MYNDDTTHNLPNSLRHFPLWGGLWHRAINTGSSRMRGTAGRKPPTHWGLGLMLFSTSPVRNEYMLSIPVSIYGIVRYLLTKQPVLLLAEIHEVILLKRFSEKEVPVIAISCVVYGFLSVLFNPPLVKR